MKKIATIALFVLFVFGGYAQNKKEVTIEAEIANRTNDTIRIPSAITYGVTLKNIVINNKGVFKDSFILEEEGIHFLCFGKQRLTVFLKGGYNVKFKVDVQKGEKSVIFYGDGAAQNTYIAQNPSSELSFGSESFEDATEEVFAKRLNEAKTAYLLELDKKNFDPKFVEFEKGMAQYVYEGLIKSHKNTIDNKKFDGTASPSFNYYNYAGGQTKLEDFRGKYVYIDIWATWCGPCVAEIPYVVQLEKKYHGKNIAFVSISVDLKNDFEKWKKFVAKNEMGAIQLYADKDWESDFIKHFNLYAIPRFILIDPNGIVVKASADRPSDPALQEQLDKLLK